MTYLFTEASFMFQNSVKGTNDLLLIHLPFHTKSFFALSEKLITQKFLSAGLQFSCTIIIYVDIVADFCLEFYFLEYLLSPVSDFIDKMLGRNIGLIF